MRSLRTAARTVVLVTLTGAAPGCGYDNPGFKLKDSDPETDSAAQTTSVSGVTMMTTTETSPTTSTTSTTEPSTTQGPGVSGSETSTDTGVDPTTETPDTTSTTTGMPTIEWPPCTLEEGIAGPKHLPVADTFLFNDPVASECPNMMGECQDQNFGATTQFPLYFDDNFSELQKGHLASILAVRFDQPPQPEHEGGFPVPDYANIGARVTIHIARPAEKIGWDSTTLNLFRITPTDIWPEGDGVGPTPCVLGGASFRCRQCKSGTVCQDEWTGGYAYPKKADEAKFKVASITVEKEPVNGLDLVFVFPLDALTWLTQAGMVMMTEVGVKKGVVEVKAKEFEKGAKGPFIELLYCPPKITPP